MKLRTRWKLWRKHRAEWAALQQKHEAEQRALDEEDPLTLIVNRAWNTGEDVYWSEGDPLPDPGGPVKPILDLGEWPPTYDPAEFDDEDRVNLERMGCTFRTDRSGVLDDGVQFISVLHVGPDGQVLHVQDFMHERAFEDAGSYMASAIEASMYSLEERLGPYGLEWEREQAERRESGG